MNCRHCKSLLEYYFVDLGFSPPSNAYLTKDELSLPEVYFPLRVMVCQHCWLVQTEDFANPELFFNAEYAYFSSTSSSWLKHAKKYASRITRQLNLDESSFVIEIASNDGYLLKNFILEKIPCLGIEPTDSTAVVAEGIGIPVLREFFGEELGKKLADCGKQADLIIGNNVYAHVPNINDFTLGIKAALKSFGTVTLEFPHLLRLIENAQFDTIYHEHFSYLSLFVVHRIFESCGLKVWHAEELDTHGGSLRVYGCHSDDPRECNSSVEKIISLERSYGLMNLKVYLNFQSRVDVIKDNLLTFLVSQKCSGKKVAAYGAAAKGSTLLNYAGIKHDLVQLIFDAAQAKQYKYMPGSHIPIFPPEKLLSESPDIVLILPWNLKEEILKLEIFKKIKKTKFVTAIPKLDLIHD